jgi:cytochrome d ubiquinol oxidase subunit II
MAPVPLRADPVPAVDDRLAVSIWPDVIPGRVSIWQAAAPYESQLFMLVGASVLMPLILGYTAWSYWVFRGKVGEEGYHAHDH